MKSYITTAVVLLLGTNVNAAVSSTNDFKIKQALL